MANRKGRVTIPTDLDVVPQTKEIMERWGADALRDCDGTEFPQELKDTGIVVNTVCPTKVKTPMCRKAWRVLLPSWAIPHK